MKKNKNKFLLIAVLVCCVALCLSTVQAQVPVIPTPETDASGAAAKATGEVQAVSNEAGKETEKGLKKFFNKIKGWYKKAAEWTGAQLESLKATKASIVSAHESANSIAASGGTVYSEAGDTAGSITSQAKNSQGGQLVTVKKEADSLNAKREERKNALIEEANGKAKAASENVSNLQAMYDSATDEDQRATISAQLEKARQENEQYTKTLSEIENDADAFLQNDSEYADLTRQYNQAMADLKEMESNALMQGAGVAADVLKNLFMSKDQRRDAYEQVRLDNFLKKDEKETPETTERVMKYRQKTMLKDLAHAMSVGVNYKKNMGELLERTDRIQRNMAAADYQQTSINMLIEQRVIDAEILHNFVEMVIADLRVRTASDLRSAPYRLNNYDQDPSILRMDNYKFTEDKIKSDAGRKSSLDKFLEPEKRSVTGVRGGQK